MVPKIPRLWGKPCRYLPCLVVMLLPIIMFGIPWSEEAIQRCLSGGQVDFGCFVALTPRGADVCVDPNKFMIITTRLLLCTALL